MQITLVYMYIFTNNTMNNGEAMLTKLSSVVFCSYVHFNASIERRDLGISHNRSWQMNHFLAWFIGNILVTFFWKLWADCMLRRERRGDYLAITWCAVHLYSKKILRVQNWVNLSGMHLKFVYCTMRVCIRYCLVCLQYRAKDCERATKLSMQVFSVDSYIHGL